ncbi:MAG: hypothetical protein OSA81_07385 [Longimicrobiales bacterium]|nr:hypothetical protein [Longimicrobiales bacterium]
MMLLVLGACGDEVTTQSTPAPEASWVGTTECASCHVDDRAEGQQNEPSQLPY